jgi:hypothetical protein
VAEERQMVDPGAGHVERTVRRERGIDEQLRAVPVRGAGDRHQVDVGMGRAKRALADVEQLAGAAREGRRRVAPLRQPPLAG